MEDKFPDVINMRASQRLRFLGETTLPLSLQDSTILGVAIERLLYVGELTSQVINKAALLSVLEKTEAQAFPQEKRMLDRVRTSEEDKVF